MGNEIFGVDIAGIIADATDGNLNEASVTIYTDGVRDENNLTGGPAQTENTITCTGIWSAFSTRDIDEQVVLTGDRKAMLIGDTIGDVIPKVGDKVVMDGDTMYIVRLLESDPARATYTYQCRGRQVPNGQ